MEDGEKVCNNCAEFVRHYTIRKECIRKIGYGHCKIPSMGKMKKPELAACPHWQPRPDNSKEQREDVFYAIRSMACSLKEIAMILDCEQEEDRDETGLEVK